MVRELKGLVKRNLKSRRSREGPRRNWRSRRRN